MVDHIIFIHGYSESSLGAYFDFPSRISAATGVPLSNVYVSAFQSLDDDVTIADLADALESHVAGLEAKGVKVCKSAIIAHSTGALIARRWMLNRVQRNRARAAGESGAKPLDLPSHFVSMAGANHGSSLAQTGKSWLGYMDKLWHHHILSVGKRVLTDLDYGSGFLLDLNRRWLIEMMTPDELRATGNGIGGALRSLYAFSMGGDIHGHEFGVDIFPPSAESGSDNTVRISGANLNYTFMVADPERETISALPARPVPHHILRNYSHWGAGTGVWGLTADPDIPVDLVLEALTCGDDGTYEKMISGWAADLEAWTKEHSADANATLVFTLHDRSNEPVEDVSVVILDKKMIDANVKPLVDATEEAAVAQRIRSTIENLQAVSHCIVNEPIRNALDRSVIAFYLNFDLYTQTAAHYYHIEAHSDTPLVQYCAIDYTGPTGATDDAHVIRANQCTYVDVTMDREARETYRIYPYPPPSVAPWNPPVVAFPEGSIE